MLRLIKIKDLEEKRKALALESDVYRETLKLQVQNLQLFSQRARHKFTSSFGLTRPWLMLLGPLLGLVMRSRRSSKVGSKMSWITTALFAWRLFKKVGALLPAIFRRRKRRYEEEEPASDF